MSRLRQWWSSLRHVEPDETLDDLLDRYGAKTVDDLIPWLFLDIPYAPDEEADKSLRTTVKEVPIVASSPTFGSLPTFDNPFSTPKSEKPSPTPRRERPAPIYVWTDPTDQRNSYEFTDPDEIDEIIQQIRRRHHEAIKRETASLKTVKAKLTEQQPPV